MFDLGGDQMELATTAPPVFPPTRAGALPAALASMEPGARLGAILESIDPAPLSGFDRVILLQAWSRQLAHVQAEFQAAMVAVAQAEATEAPWADEEHVFDLASSEIGVSLSWTRRAAEFHLGFAQDLVDRYHPVWRALRSGRIDFPKARVLVEQTRHLDQELAEKICEIGLQRGSEQTTGQLRARLQRLVIAVDPDSARKRYEQSVLGRRVISEANDTGTGNILGLDLPTAELNAVMRRINRLARAARSSDEERTMDQLRADIFLDLLAGRYGADHNRQDQCTVDIRVDLDTLLEFNDSPAEIPGWGPVIADVARRLVEEQENTRFRVTVTDPVTGEVVHVGHARRRPTAAQKRRVQAEAPDCVFPRCPMPSPQCDIDHRLDWVKGGPTKDDNLQPLCRFHHRLKHIGWKVEQIRPGIYQWTSPLGHVYTTGPDPP